jgi:hypothetical protein
LMESAEKTKNMSNMETFVKKKSKYFSIQYKGSKNNKKRRILKIYNPKKYKNRY